MSTITIFKNITETAAGFHRDINYVFGRIRTGASKEQVTLIRLESEKDKRNILKKDLTSICFSGTFSNRSAAGLIKHSGYICLDFDGFESDDVAKTWRDTLESWEYAYSVFTSPSGNGLKVIVRIPPDEKLHKAHFEAIAAEFDCQYFDISTSDVSRVCYESYDPLIHINEDALMWIKTLKQDEKVLGDERVILPMVSHSRIITRLDSWWQRKYGSTKGSRNSNMFRLAAAFNDFGVDQMDAEQHCQRYSEQDFPESEISRVVKSAYKKSESFGSKMFNDDFMVERLDKSIRSGKSVSAIKRDFSGYAPAQVEEAIEEMKETMSITEFWTYDSKGKLTVVPHKYRQFLEQNQFCKFFPDGTEEFVFVKIEGNLVSPTSEDRMKDFVLNYLESKSDIGYGPYDFMASQTKLFKTDYLSMIKTTDIKINPDTKDSCFLYFNNCALEVVKDKVRKIDYIDLDGFVWKNHIIDREYSRSGINASRSIFESFLFLVANKDVVKFNSLRSVIGYMMHSYKTNANNKAIILNDETISDNPNGGSGKGIFCTAIGHMKRTAILDGKHFSFDKSFPYQTVGADTQILLFDDVKKNFRFENLFSIITEGITLEKKNRDAIHIPVTKSPKVIITTNYTLGGVGGSHERRKFEVEFSGYFNSSHTPLDEFKQDLFTSWDKDEWSRFDNFMVGCVQFYLTYGLVQHDFNNLELRKFIKETSTEFIEWCGEMPDTKCSDLFHIGIRMDKRKLFDGFVAEYPDMRGWLSQRMFTKWIELYAQKNKLDVEQGKSLEMRWIKLSEPGAEMVEEEDIDDISGDESDLDF